MADLAFRPYAAADHSFVVTKWLRSFRLSHGAGVLLMGPWSGGTAMYFDVQREVIERLLERPDVSVIMAHKPGEEPPFDLYGFVVVERAYPYPKMRDALVDVVHYLFVDEPFRRNGLGAELLRQARLRDSVIYTHLTADGQKLARSRGYRYDPHCARFGRGENPKELR